MTLIELRVDNENNKDRLDPDSFVDIIRDVLKMKKNLCICRSLNTLKKDQIRAKTTPIYIDVWPVSKLYWPLILLYLLKLKNKFINLYFF